MVERSTVLHVEHLRKVYESATGSVEAIGDVTFTMNAGELLCIVGPSGCGKTTLLKCIAGLLRPTSGVIEVNGTPVTGPTPSMALVFQEYGRSLYPWLTVREMLFNDKGELVREAPNRRRRGTNIETPLSASNEPPPGHTRKETEGVFAIRDGKAIYLPVKVGIAGEQYFEVLDGLKAGDQVITGPFSSVRELTDGQAVKIQQSTRRTNDR